MHYNKKNLELLRMQKIDTQTGYIVSGPTIKSTSPIIFKIEKDLTVNEKIAFIDNYHNDIATYLLNLIYRWEREKKYLPRDRQGKPTISSKKEWLRRNDTLNVTNRGQHALGSYRLFRTIFSELSITCPCSELGYTLTYTDKHIAEQWFHDLLIQLHREEMKSINTHWAVTPK